MESFEKNSRNFYISIYVVALNIPVITNHCIKIRPFLLYPVPNRPRSISLETWAKLLPGSQELLETTSMKTHQQMGRYAMKYAHPLRRTELIGNSALIGDLEE